MSMHPHAPVFPNSMQEIFDKALAHIRSTREPSMQSLGAGNESCSYRGCGCAMAPFAPSDEAKAEWDGWGGIGCVIDAFGYKGAAGIEEQEVLDLVSAVQESHDAPAITGLRSPEARETFMQDFEAQMRRVAVDNDLKYTPEVTA